MSDIITLFETFTESQQPERLVPLSVEEARDRVQELCPGYAPGGSLAYPNIYRGSYQNRSAYYCTPNASRRRSANSGNDIYSLCLETQTQYPKRLSSLITSLDQNYASSYGNLFVAVPKRGTLVGICPAGDIYQSFPDTIGPLGFKSMGMLSSAIRDMIYELTGAHTINIRSIEEAKAALDAVDVAVDGLFGSVVKSKLATVWRDGIYSLIQYAQICQKSLFDALVHILDMDEAGFKRFRYGEEDLPVPLGDVDHETWFEGPCVLIQMSDYKKLYA